MGIWFAIDFQYVHENQISNHLKSYFQTAKKPLINSIKKKYHKNQYNLLKKF
jgi:hypothetical protein